MRKTRIEVSNFKNAYININVGVLYLKLFMHVTVFCFVLFCFVLLCYVMLCYVMLCYVMVSYY